MSILLQNAYIVNLSTKPAVGVVQNKQANFCDFEAYLNDFECNFRRFPPPPLWGYINICFGELNETRVQYQVPWITMILLV